MTRNYRAVTVVAATLAACAPAAVSAPTWQWQKTILPEVLVVDGLWAEHFRIDAALDKAGIRKGYGLDDLSRYTVIIFANASLPRLPEGALARVREFVSEGGGLVVLGGLSAYGNGGYAGTPLEGLLPASLQKSYIGHFPSAEEGASLAPSALADWSLPVDFAAQPTAYYFHTLVPRDEARVQITVGDRPAFISGSFGSGRVVACALTVNGDPTAGVVPFWDWRGWPALLAQAVSWAGGARPEGTRSGIAGTVTLKPLTEDELEAAELGMAELPRDFVARARARPDERTAAILFHLATPGSGADEVTLALDSQGTAEAACGLETVLPALLPYARPEWAPRLRKVADPMEPVIERRRAALILLGACRDPSVYPLLLKALNDGQTELAALDGLGRLGEARAIPPVRKHFDAVLAPARLPDGPGRWKPAEFADASRPAAHAAVALYRLGDPEGVRRLCALASHLNLYRRIMWNAGKRWPRDPQGQAILKAIVARANTLQEAWDFLRNNVGPIPDSQVDAFTAHALSVTDPVIVELLALALEQSAGAMPGEALQRLSGAESGIIVRMSRVLAGKMQKNR